MVAVNSVRFGQGLLLEARPKRSRVKEEPPPKVLERMEFRLETPYQIAVHPQFYVSNPTPLTHDRHGVNYEEGVNLVKRAGNTMAYAIGVLSKRGPLDEQDRHDASIAMEMLKNGTGASTCAGRYMTNLPLNRELVKPLWLGLADKLGETWKWPRDKRRHIELPTAMPLTSEELENTPKPLRAVVATLARLPENTGFYRLPRALKAVFDLKGVTVTEMGVAHNKSATGKGIESTAGKAYFPKAEYKY